MAKSTALAPKGDAPLAVIPNINDLIMRPGAEAAEVYEADEDAGLGMENAKLYEQRIPILRVLDPKSPQCKPVSQGGIQGAKGGAIFNTSTGQVYDGERGLFIVIAARDEKYPCYRKRDEDGGGGGFVRIHDPDDPIVKQRQEERLAEVGDLFGKLPNGTDDDGNELELVQTFYQYAVCIVPGDDGAIPPLAEAEMFRGMIPYSSTQIKKYTSWFERHSNIKVPMRQPDGTVKPSTPAIWSHVWHLTTQYESKGSFSWYGWKLQLAVKNEDGSEAPTKLSRLDPKGPLYKMGKDLFLLFDSGEAKPEYEKDATQPEVVPQGGGAHSGGSGGRDPNEIPFGT